MSQTQTNNKKIVAYIDGSCLGNPGPGGWGVALRYGEHSKDLYGSEQHTTNNRMELMAAIQALKQLKEKVDITLITDSNYVCNGITKWLEGWKRVNWKPKGRSAIKNQDLWQMLDQLVQSHNTTWQWVKGHSGDPGNELADELARQGAEEAKRKRG